MGQKVNPHGLRVGVISDNDIWFPEGYIYEDTSFYLKLRPFVKKQAKMLGVYVYHRDRKSVV